MAPAYTAAPVLRRRRRYAARRALGRAARSARDDYDADGSPSGGGSDPGALSSPPR